MAGEYGVMTNLYLIRHGQADGLKPGVNGTVLPNAGLSPTGVRQAERLRDRLANTAEIHADVLLSSPLQRASETAQIIAPALRLPVMIEEDFQEINLGEAEGLTDEQITERFGLFHLEQDPFRRIALTGESLAAFHLRACRALDRILREYAGKSIVIVGHGGIVNASFIYFLGLTMLKYPPIVLTTRNTALTHWRQGPFEGYGRAEPQWFLERFNDYRHLEDEQEKSFPLA